MTHHQTLVELAAMDTAQRLKENNLLVTLPFP